MLVIYCTLPVWNSRFRLLETRASDTAYYRMNMPEDLEIHPMTTSQCSSAHQFQEQLTRALRRAYGVRRAILGVTLGDRSGVHLENLF